MADEQFVIFRLGDQEYGLPIHAVDEIARHPTITRLPKSPAYRWRHRSPAALSFDRRSAPAVPDLLQSHRRAHSAFSSLPSAAGKTGFMVDSISEVMKVPADAIRPAPEVSAEQIRLIGRVANLDARMILLVDPAQLLDRVEADVLAKFQSEQVRSGIDESCDQASYRGRLRTDEEAARRNIASGS